MYISSFPIYIQTSNLNFLSYELIDLSTSSSFLFCSDSLHLFASSCLFSRIKYLCFGVVLTVIEFNLFMEPSLFRSGVLAIERKRAEFTPPTFCKQALLSISLSFGASGRFPLKELIRGVLEDKGGIWPFKNWSSIFLEEEWSGWAGDLKCVSMNLQVFM